jgi:hypothetical protein
MNFAPLYGAIAATAAIRRTPEERRKYEEGFASLRHQAIERFEQLEDEAGQSVDELRTKQQDIEARLNEIFPPIKTDNKQHPVAPPPELVEQWMQVHSTKYDLARQAAQWGADRELDACCEWLSDLVRDWADELRAERRPKPPSLKELALESVKRFEKSGEFFSDQMRELEFIRKALEQLPND